MNFEGKWLLNEQPFGDYSSLKVVVTIATVIVTGIHATVLETVCPTDMDTGRRVQAFR